MKKMFTLIELMIVVAIIAIIAAIAIPNLMASRMQANETAAVANLRAYAGAQAIFHKGGYSMRAGGDNGFVTGDEIRGITPKKDYYDKTTRRYAYPFSDLYNVTASSASGAGPAALIPGSFAAAISTDTSFQGYYYADFPMPESGKASPGAFGLFGVAGEYGTTGNNLFAINTQGVVKSGDQLDDIKSASGSGESAVPGDLDGVDPFKKLPGKFTWIDA